VHMGFYCGGRQHFCTGDYCKKISFRIPIEQLWTVWKFDRQWRGEVVVMIQ